MRPRPAGAGDILEGRPESVKTGSVVDQVASDFVVAGYVPSSTSRKAIGSLVLGYYEDGKLIHAGRVGTGYTAAYGEDLYQRLERIRLPSSPFAERLSADAARQVRYVKPQLRCRGRVPQLDGRPESAPRLVPWLYRRTMLMLDMSISSSSGAAPAAMPSGPNTTRSTISAVFRLVTM